jgi:hypothetical protein
MQGFHCSGGVTLCSMNGWEGLNYRCNLICSSRNDDKMSIYEGIIEGF